MVPFECSTWLEVAQEEWRGEDELRSARRRWWSSLLARMGAELGGREGESEGQGEKEGRGHGVKELGRSEASEDRRRVARASGAWRARPEEHGDQRVGEADKRVPQNLYFSYLVLIAELRQMFVKSTQGLIWLQIFHKNSWGFVLMGRTLLQKMFLH